MSTTEKCELAMTTLIKDTKGRTTDWESRYTKVKHYLEKMQKNIDIKKITKQVKHTDLKVRMHKDNLKDPGSHRRTGQNKKL